jgi:hypothetical protein
MVLTNQSRRWVKTDDQHLFELIESGEVDHLDESLDNIQKIRDTHFSWCLLKNFSVNYRKKVREYNTAQTLAGARGKKKLL